MVVGMLGRGGSGVGERFFKYIFYKRLLTQTGIRTRNHSVNLHLKYPLAVMLRSLV